MDDLLADPGILVGEVKVDTCRQGINLLLVRAAAGADRKDDPAHLLVAQLDLTAGFGGDKVLPLEAGQLEAATALAGSNSRALCVPWQGVSAGAQSSCLPAERLSGCPVCPRSGWEATTRSPGQLLARSTLEPTS